MSRPAPQGKSITSFFPPKKPPQPTDNPPRNASAGPRTPNTTQQAVSQRNASQSANAGRKSASASTTTTLDNNPAPPPEEEPATEFEEPYDARKWLVDQALLGEEEEVPSIGTLADILKDVANSPEKPRSSLENTMRAVATILELYEQIEDQTQDNREEGEVPKTDNTPVSDNNNVLSEMKHFLQEMEDKLQDRVDRAIKALEDTVKDYRQKADAPSPPARHTYSEATQQNPVNQPRRQTPPHPPHPPHQHNETRALEREKTRARQLVLDIGSDHGFTKMSNVGIRDECRKALKSSGAPAEYDILMVSKLRKGGVLLETNKVEVADWLKNPGNAGKFRSYIKVNADFTKRTYTIIAKFVQCAFDPEDQKHIEDLKDENCWDGSTLVRVRWAKPIERRSPHQTHAHLILTFTDENEANTLLTGRGYIYVWGRRIQVEKDKRIPVRCAKCQMYGHFVSECLQQEDTCARCAMKGHRHQQCDPSNIPRCANCNEDGHEAYSNTCPIFQKKLTVFNERTPENSIPYYPTPPTPTQAEPTPKPNSQ